MTLQKTGLTLALLFVVTVAFAQHEERLGLVGQADAPDVHEKALLENNFSRARALFPVLTQRSGQNANQKRVHTLEKIWQSSDSGSTDRKKVEKMLKTMLDSQFDAHLEKQKKELAEVERRIQKLRSRLDRRVDSKDEIVELQSKQILMSWEGLGWNDSGKTVGPNWRQNLSELPSRLSNDFSDVLYGALVDMGEKLEPGYLTLLAGKYADGLAESDPTEANNQLWRIYEATHEQVDSPEFWNLLATGAEKVADDARPNMLAVTLDTVAHLHYEAGNLDKAIEYQKKAVKEGKGNPQFQEFLDKLTTEKDK